MLSIIAVPVGSFALAMTWAVYDRWDNERAIASIDRDIQIIDRELTAHLIQEAARKEAEMHRLAYEENVAKFDAEMRLSARNIAESKKQSPLASLDSPYPVYRYKFRDEPETCVLARNKDDDLALFADGYHAWEDAPYKNISALQNAMQYQLGDQCRFIRLIPGAGRVGNGFLRGI